MSVLQEELVQEWWFNVNTQKFIVM